MNSYEFEVVCKNEIINEVKAKYNETLKIEELQMVWFSKSLQNYKCCICDLRPSNQRYYECTFNGNKDELYVDIYEKAHNTKVLSANFNKVVKR